MSDEGLYETGNILEIIDKTRGVCLCAGRTQILAKRCTAAGFFGYFFDPDSPGYSGHALQQKSDNVNPFKIRRTFTKGRYLFKFDMILNFNFVGKLGFFKRINCMEDYIGVIGSVLGTYKFYTLNDH